MRNFRYHFYCYLWILAAWSGITTCKDGSGKMWHGRKPRLKERLQGLQPRRSDEPRKVHTPAKDGRGFFINTAPKVIPHSASHSQSFGGVHHPTDPQILKKPDANPVTQLQPAPWQLRANDSHCGRSVSAE